MTLLAAVHSVTGTFHSFAAAWTSIMRAVAPPLRTYSCEVRMPRLPPVEKSPHARLRATLWPGVGYSVVTFDQSHSSSSATSWARPVRVPCPISERAIRMTTVSSGRITTQALTSGAPTAAVPMTKARRLSVGIWFMAASSSARGGVNSLTRLLEGAAAANIGDGLVDVLIGRLRLLLEQCCDRHDHSALAISALRDVIGDPGLLNLVQCAFGGQSFDGRDLLADSFADHHAARSHRDAVDMDGAGAALRNAATIFGAGQAGIFPDRPQQRCVRLDIHVESFAIDNEVCHR